MDAVIVNFCVCVRFLSHVFDLGTSASWLNIVLWSLTLVAKSASKMGLARPLSHQLDDSGLARDESQVGHVQKESVLYDTNYGVYLLRNLLRAFHSHARTLQ